MIKESTLLAQRVAELSYARRSAQHGTRLFSLAMLAGAANRARQRDISGSLQYLGLGALGAWVTRSVEIGIATDAVDGKEPSQDPVLPKAGLTGVALLATSKIPNLPKALKVGCATAGTLTTGFVVRDLAVERTSGSAVRENPARTSQDLVPTSQAPYVGVGSAHRDVAHLDY